MIVYGGGSAKKYGTIDKVILVFGIRSVVEFGGVEVNSEFDILMKAVETAKNEKIDFLLAVGGGLVMDGIKFISLVMYYEKEVSDIFFYGFVGVFVIQVILFGCIVIFLATGSESNAFSVVTFNEQKYPVMFFLIFPRFLIFDSDFTKTFLKE